MKRAVAAILILISTFGISCYLEISSKNILRESSENFYACCEKEANENLDLIKLEEALRVWENKKKFLFLVSNEDDFSDVENNIIDLENIMKKYNFKTSREICLNTAIILKKKVNEYSLNLLDII